MKLLIKWSLAILVVLAVGALASCKAPGPETSGENGFEGNASGGEPSEGETPEESAFVNICGRTPQIRDVILENLPGVSCDQVTLKQLGTITIRLDLSSRGITALKAGDFDGLTNLKHLTFSHNGLSSLPPGVFDELVNLDQLTLRYNGLSSLPPDVFDELVNLERLLLNYNDLSSLPPGIFQNLLKLDALHIHGNAFDCIPRNAFGSRKYDDYSDIEVVPALCSS